MRKVPITKPYFDKEEKEAIQRPLESGWVVQGPFVKEFEDKFSAFSGAKHSIATTSCTTALHIAVAALDLKPGEEVIVPAFTWVSTANVVEFMGAKPVFCDIDADTFNIDPHQIQALITPKTVGIIPVHLFGLCADMPAIMEIAKANALWVVEDAACGLGGTIGEQHAGTFGDMGCFSFHPRKSITTGEGGMITTQDAELAEKCRSLRDHGASKSDLERHTSQDGFLLPEYKLLGYNYRMTDIQGALGSIQMDRADFILDERRKTAAIYDHLLADVDFLDAPTIPSGNIHGYQAYVTAYLKERWLDDVEELNRERNQVMARLEQKGIATRQGTHAVVNQEWYAKKYGYSPSDFPVSNAAEKLSLSLPVYVGLEPADQEWIVEEILKAQTSA